MTHVSMMQPSFLPWLGYFELIYQAEIFVLLDDFQFSVQSYHQRNRLFVNKGQVDWYSVPVQKSLSFQKPLNKTLINENTPWRNKLWRRIQQNYGKTEYFSIYKTEISDWLLSHYSNLAEQNIAFIQLICKILGLEKRLLKSSEKSSEKQRSDRVVELLNWTGASRYYCAQGSFGYMFEDQVFPLKQVDVLFQNFQLQAYPQKGSPAQFVPYLCVLDALFNRGPEETLSLIKSGTQTWYSWQDMVRKKQALQDVQV